MRLGSNQFDAKLTGVYPLERTGEMSELWFWDSPIRAEKGGLMSVISFNASFKQALIGGTALLSCMASPAFAADAAGADAATAPAASGDIVVTAQRRSERLVDVPMSVAAVSAEAVAKSGAISVHDINRLAPGIQINFAGISSQPAIRGITTLTTGIGYENNVAIYIDGIYAPDNLSINGDLGGLAGIEVLKGPQGTLWGRNATGGAILMNSKAPSSVLTGKFELGVARFGELSESGYVSGPLSKSVRASLSVYNRDSNGYITQQVNNATLGDHTDPIRQASVRAKIEADLSDNTKATVGANYSLSSDARGITFTVFELPVPALQAITRATTPNTASGTVLPYARAVLKEGTFKLEHKADFGTITSNSGYSVRRTSTLYDFDSSSADTLISQAEWVQKTFQTSLDVNVTSITNLNLIFGASYYHDNLFSNLQYGFGAFSGNTATTTNLTAEAFAGYADATYHITDKLVFNAGGRYTHETKAIGYQLANRITGAISIPAPATGLTMLNQSVSFSAFTPKGSLRYEITPRTNVYASISRGFRTGGWNPNGGTLDANGNLISFLPEKITAYEVGFKTSNPMFQFETAGFYYDYTNLQVAQSVFVTGRGLSSLVSNAPKATVYGIDAMLTAHPVDNLNAKIGLAWLHARYGTFQNATGTGVNATTGLNVTNAAQDWSNLQMARAPDFSGNVSLDYTFQDVAGGKVNMGGSLLFTSSFTPNNPATYGPLAAPALVNVQRFRQDAYATLNLQASWATKDDAYKLTVYVNNVTNKLYKEAYNGSTLTGDYAVWSQPITAGARISAQF